MYRYSIKPKKEIKDLWNKIKGLLLSLTHKNILTNANNIMSMINELKLRINDLIKSTYINLDEKMILKTIIRELDSIYDDVNAMYIYRTEEEILHYEPFFKNMYAFMKKKINAVDNLLGRI